MMSYHQEPNIPEKTPFSRVEVSKVDTIGCEVNDSDVSTMA
jgi:hypothetical protein